MADKRYYWLKLKEDFFEDNAIEWLEEQQNGKELFILLKTLFEVVTFRRNFDQKCWEND